MELAELKYRHSPDKWTFTRTLCFACHSITECKCTWQVDVQDNFCSHKPEVKYAHIHSAQNKCGCIRFIWLATDFLHWLKTRFRFFPSPIVIVYGMHMLTRQGAGSRSKYYQVLILFFWTWEWDSDHVISENDKNRSYCSPSVWARTLKGLISFEVFQTH